VARVAAWGRHASPHQGVIVSLFTSKVTKTLTFPAAPDQTVVIRKLAPKHLAKAARAAQARMLEDVEAMGGADVIKKFQGAFKTDEPKAEPDESPADPLAGYEPVTLIVSGVTSWTLEEPLTPEWIDQLDGDTQEWLAREVLRLAKPSLFLTAEEAAAQRKNG
jgi:hypothetical protein